jgi:WD40 repeat protein
MIDLWDVAASSWCQRLQGHTNLVDALTFTFDDTFLISGSHDTTIRVWDLRTSTQHLSWVGHPIRTMALAVRPRGGDTTTGAVLVSSGCDELIKVWGAETGECLRTLRAPGPYQDMNITDAQGLNQTQKQALISLGAVEQGKKRE